MKRLYEQEEKHLAGRRDECATRIAVKAEGEFSLLRGQFSDLWWVFSSLRARGPRTAAVLTKIGRFAIFFSLTIAILLW